MKKRFLKNTIIISFVFAVVSIVLYFSYKFISERIIEDTIGINVTAVGESVTDILAQQLNHDYDETKRLIDFYHGSQALTNHAEQVSYLQSVTATFSLASRHTIHFGQFVSEVVDEKNETYYLINGVKYVGINSQFNDDYEKNVINFCNFKKGYNAFGGDNAFEDEIYLVFRFDHIIVYLKAESYINTIYDYEKSVPIKALFMFSQDGFVSYQDDTSITQFFDFLKAENSNIQVNNVIEKVRSLDQHAVDIISMKYQGDNAYMTITNLTRWGSEHDIYIAMFFDQKVVAKILDAVSAPLMVSFILLDLSLIIVSFISNFLSNSRNNDLDSSLLYQNNNKIYKITLKSNNRMVLNNRFKNLLKDPASFKTFNDFKFKQVHEDYKQAAFQQRTLTINLTTEQTADETEKFICFMPLKTFQKRILVGVDVTADEKKYLEYYRFALFDIHTDLPNIQLVKNDIRDVISEIKEIEDTDKKAPPINAFTAFSIESFEKYDIIFGQLMGKKLLLEVIDHIKNLISDYDAKLYYLDTGTFGVLFKKIVSYDIVVAWAQMVMNHFSKPLEIDGNNLIVEFFFGIFNIDLKVFPDIDSGQVVSNALRSLSKVKSFGTNRYDVFDASLIRFISNEEVLQQDLRHAIENDEFVMALQAQYDVEQMRIAGFELLLRWNNPKYLNQSPAHYIEIAEKNSMIIQIGRIILNKSFSIIKKLEQYDLTFSVNISPVQLIQAGFVNDLVSLADEYQVNYRHIALEITETFLMENFKVINEKLKLLKKKGFVIHLDDFGTGYSSMLYLKELPIDAIKIDKEFTFQISTDKYSREIVSKIISMAKNLSLEIIAEGVEDEKQLAFLHKNGCNIVQGYLISKPIMFDEAVQLLINQKDILQNDPKKDKTKRK